MVKAYLPVNESFGFTAELRDALLEALALPRLHDDLARLRILVQRISALNLPVVENALRECLSGSGGPEFSRESEGLVDRQISLNHEHGSSRNLGLFENVATLLVQHAVDTADGLFGALDLDEID